MQTDLALEVKESFPGDGGEIPGVVLDKKEKYQGKILITTVEILDEKGESAMGKPKGTYITIETPWLKEEIYENQCMEVMLDSLKKLLPKKSNNILAVGLGNRQLTADALGPEIIDKLCMTRHFDGEGKKLSGIVPGVMAQTGMETVEIVKGIVKQTKPDIVIVFDALAACSAKRLCRTIQLTDTGIQPGSGVGNHRKEFSEQVLGIPVIAIGVPTVIHGAALAGDLIHVVAEFFKREEQTKMLGTVLEQMSEGEHRQLLGELLPNSAGNLFVTPKDMDEQVDKISTILANAVNCMIMEA